MGAEESWGRAREFLDLFREVEEHLRKLSGPQADFGQVIAKAAALNSRVAEGSGPLSTFYNLKMALSAYSALRNALSHNNPAGDMPIAVPTTEAMTTLRTIADSLLVSPPLYSVMQQTTVFEPAEPLLDALRMMRSKKYSQIVTRSSTEQGGQVALLTVEGIARWMEETLDEGYVRAEGVTIGEVLAYEPPNGFVLMRSGDPVDKARELFAAPIHQDPEQVRVYAILVTRRGKGTEKLLGIVTPWDIFG